MMAGATHKMDISEMNTKRSSLDSGSATRKSKETTNEVQSEVFTKWVNMKLKIGNDKAEAVDWNELSSAFRNGLVLYDLLQVVCTKKPSKVRRENFRKIVEVANLNVIFNTLSKNDVKVVNIGPEDIWDGNIKIILGLLWTIIYHFQVRAANFGEFDAQSLGAKVALLMWIQSKIPEMEVKNLVGDWKDGRALAALVNAISRDFKLDEPFDDPEALSPFEAEATLEKAMAHADKNLGVGRLVTPEQVVSDDIGEKSMMTYLSQFAGAKKPVVEPKKVGGLRGTLSRAFTKKKSSAVPAEEPKKEPEAPVIVFEAPVHPEFLAKVEDLFYAMDVDQNGRVTKIELVEFLREYKPKDTTVAKIQKALGLVDYPSIDQPTFVAAFNDGKLDIESFDLQTIRAKVRRAKKEREEAAARAGTAEAHAAKIAEANAAKIAAKRLREEEQAREEIARQEAERQRALKEAEERAAKNAAMREKLEAQARAREEEEARKRAEEAAKMKAAAEAREAAAREREEEARRQREEEELKRAKARAAAEKAEADKAAAEKAAADKAAAARAAAAAERAAADKAAAEKAAAEKAAADKAAAEKAAADKAAADKAAADKAAADKAAADKAAADKAAADAAAKKAADEEAAAAAAAAATAAAAASSLPPPEKRAADWRVYTGPDLGGRCKIRVYFSTTTSSQKIRGDTEKMKMLMERHNYHKRPDFEQFIPIDIDMDKPTRDKIFEKAGQRMTPMLFVDDEFVGVYDAVAELDENGELDRIMQY